MVSIADCLLAMAPLAGRRPLAVLLASDHAAERLSLIARQAFAEVPVLYCPGSDALPGDGTGASPANAGQRNAALRALGEERGEGPAPILICGAEATVPGYAPPEAFRSHPLMVRVGDKLDLAAFRVDLIALGYLPDERIDEPGEVGEAGAVLDVFPVAAALPVRIEVEDGRVRSLRQYDPLSQVSTQDIERHSFGSAAEPPLPDRPVPLLSHSPSAQVLLDPGFTKARARLLELAAEIAPSGEAARIDAAEWDAELAGRDCAEIVAGDPVPHFAGRRRPAQAVKVFLEGEAAAGRRLIVAGSARDTRFFARRLAPLLSEDLPRFSGLVEAIEGEAPVALLELPLDEGTRHGGLTLMAATDLLGSRAEGEHVLAGGVATDPLAIALRLGDAVVHDEFGVGILRGVEDLALPGHGRSAVIELEYAKGAVRQVPIADAGRLWRYGGDGAGVTLDTLDGKSWAKRRVAIDAAIADAAKHLRALARRRENAEAPVYEASGAAYERFVGGFAYSETAEQRAAIDAVRGDLAVGKPMDRLVIGDVGYGKTEVALRAAAIVALSGAQVAIVAPTTLLARQHLEEFTRRFRRVGIDVVSLSRANSAAEQKAARAALADGSAKVVVGTSAIAGKGTRFADLGLVIIDEEQRFGAAQKAKLEALGHGHVLRLSATPIPRTLQSALVGIGEVSLITTPPARRVPVQTKLGDFDETAVRAALLREYARRGQSFVVVPRIEDLPGMTDLLARLVPDLSVVTVHGKLGSAEADEALIGFAQRRGDILLATSIIETGLDVPRANTMIIAGSDRFGVAQLHQLRGRVGRSARRGYVLMLSAPGSPLTEKTRARLGQLAAHAALGAGFAVAAGDLDLRGAGDLAGEDQSGHVKLIGLELYQTLLARELRQLAGDPPVPPLAQVESGGDALLPEDWIVDSEARIAAYIHLARIEEAGELDRFADELEDRYGALPAPALQLLATRRLALAARDAGIARVQVGPGGIAFTPRPGARVTPGEGQRMSDGRIIAARHETAAPLEDAADALEILASA
ncbi:helicase-related protein [Qipengyuania sediminis]|uniref:helicase-related protein n=1 Tax=Qipengyuania sediminis TaxID=1532023 RepID=UPI00197F2E22|nr:helicase-related protein [Qipengyuania sediminis]